MTGIRDIGAMRSLKGVAIRDESGIIRTAQQGFVRDGTTLRQIYSAFAASAAPASVAGYAVSFAPTTITTTVVTATPDGGVGPFTYAWSLVSSSAGIWDAVLPTSQSTQLRCAAVPQTSTYTATFKCTVTDSLGNVVETNIVNASVSNLR